MPRARRFALFILIGLIAATQTAWSAALRVEPVSVEVAAPGASSTLTLRNEASDSVAVQIRVFRWQQVDGEDKLEPTDDVVASPPAVTLSKGNSNIVRVVRVSKAPVAREESYRVWVDQLPDRVVQPGQVVNFLVRYSIPVFFTNAQANAPALDWSASVRRDAITISAVNKGDRRMRVSALKIRDEKGQTHSFGNGLIGYVLARSSMNWTAPVPSSFNVGGSVSITAESDSGPVNAVAKPSARR